MDTRAKLFIAGLFLSLPLFVFAHPGNTDSYGCHTCRTNCSSWGLSYGEYHCHSSKGLPQPEYPIRSHYDEGGAGWTEPWPDYYNSGIYQYPSIPSCPLFSYYDSSSASCKCNYGYVVDSGTCVDGDVVCHRKHGYSSSYDSLSNSCKCDYGYLFNLYGQCVSRDNYCQSLFDYNAEYDILTDSCKCKDGYVANSSKTGCIDTDTYCVNLYGFNASYDSYEKKCECDYGYEFRNGRCQEIIEENFYIPRPEINEPAYIPLPTIQSPTPAPTVIPKIEIKTTEQPSSPISQSKEIEIDASRIKLFDKGRVGVLVVNGILRKCPSTECAIVGGYSKGYSINILGIYDGGEWYKVEDEKGGVVINSGWMHNSLFGDEARKQILKSDYKEVSPERKDEPKKEVRWYQKLFNLFRSFGR